MSPIFTKLKFTPPIADAIQMIAVTTDELEQTLLDAPTGDAAWLSANGFTATIGAVCVCPDKAGGIGMVYVGMGAAGQKRV